MADLNDDVHDAICQALAKHETSLLTRWVLVAESVEDDGSRGLWLQADDTAKPWDVLGLLHFAITQQEAQIHRDSE